MKAAVPPGRELFDLKKDPKELKSVYADRRYKNTVVNMKDELKKLCIQYDVTDKFLNDYVPPKKRVKKKKA